MSRPVSGCDVVFNPDSRAVGVSVLILECAKRTLIEPLLRVSCKSDVILQFRAQLKAPVVAQLPTTWICWGFVILNSRQSWYQNYVRSQETLENIVN